MIMIIMETHEAPGEQNWTQKILLKIMKHFKI